MIIGLVGTLGAGKGTVAAYLTKKNRNFTYLSVRNFLAAEALRHGKLVSRISIAQAANELKTVHGDEYIVKELLRQAQGIKHHVVIESLRTPAEARYLKAQGAKLWAVETDAKLRFVRLMESKKEADRISFEKFSADEKAELASTNSTEEGLLEAMKLADVTITNNGTLEELYKHVDELIVQALTQNIK